MGIFYNILIGATVGLTFSRTIGYVAWVDGVSMQPTLNPNIKKPDYVFLNRWAIRGYSIERGDIISFISPKNPEEKLIKRVVGLAGDTIVTLGYKEKILKVPDGHCWVEGDNTGLTRDSNTFGPISLGLITAKATCILWPYERMQLLTPSLPQNRVPLNLSKPLVA